MKFIPTNRYTYDNKELFIFYQLNENRFDMFIRTDPNGTDYGSLIMFLSSKYCNDGIYLDSITINYEKFPKENLKGLGKFMLCTSISILLNEYHLQFDKICLNAYSELYDTSFKAQNWTDEDLMNYIKGNVLAQKYYKEYMINFGEFNKEEIIEELSRAKSEEKLIKYYETYGFKVAERYAKGKTGTFMVAELSSIKTNCKI